LIVILAIFAMILPGAGDRAPATPQPPHRESKVGHVPPDNRWKVVRPYNAKLERMAMCESTKRWHLNTGNSFYGGLQFTIGTWRETGGRGYPHQASQLEQKYRAVIWFKKIGTWVTRRGWPHCGYA
jgi:hypothetical protein